MSSESAPIRAAWRLAWRLVLALVAVGWVVSMAQAQELHLANLVLNNFEGKIRVRFGVEPSNADQIRQLLDNGERLALRCRASLSAKRDYLWNRELTAASFESDLRRLRGGDFAVTLPGQGPMVDKDLTALFRKAWNEILIDLGPWEHLERGQTYVLSLHLSLVRPDVSQWLSRGLFFLSFDAAPPVSYQLDFTY
jgi:hypothetical protein